MLKSKIWTACEEGAFSSLFSCFVSAVCRAGGMGCPLKQFITLVKFLTRMCDVICKFTISFPQEGIKNKQKDLIVALGARL